jgi:hypothetical protein
MRKDICVQHWVSKGETRWVFEFEYARRLVVSISNAG